MTVKQLFDIYYNGLKDLYGKYEARAITETVMEGFHDIGRNRIYTDNGKTIEVYEEIIQENLKKLKNFYPVQYLNGKTLFYNRIFEVNEHVLIPRNETEELVYDILLSDYPKMPDILDIGCGSGAIAVTLAAHIAGSAVEALDISEDALVLAMKNAEKNGTENIKFIKADILSVDMLWKKFDIIVSNPPYVRECEKKDMCDNVLLYEPHTALFVEDSSPLVFYEKISALASTGLKDGGALYFEINENFGKEIKEMLENKGFSDVIIKKDLNDKDRMARAIWKRK